MTSMTSVTVFLSRDPLPGFDRRMTAKGLMEGRVEAMEYTVNKSLNPVLNEPFFSERSKILNFHQDSKTNENEVQTSLQHHENGLIFWKNELDASIEKVALEKKNLEHCLAFIEHNHNHYNSLLDSVKRCRDFRLYGNLKGAGNPSDETDKALFDEYQILLSCSQTCVRLGRQVLELKGGLENIELDLIEDLEKKVSSLATTFQCEMFFKSSTNIKNQTEKLNTIKEDNFQYQPSNENIPVNLRSESTGGSWYEEIFRRLERARNTLSQSAQFRNNVKDTFDENTMKINNAWHQANAKIQFDSKVSEAEREKAIYFLTHVSNDLATTRERISALKGEIEKHSRNLEAALKRVGVYQLKPGSEHIPDEPIMDMKKQLEATTKIIQSLQTSLEECLEQEKKLTVVEKELRKSLTRATRVLHTHHDQVSGQRRSINHALPINQLTQ